MAREHEQAQNATARLRRALLRLVPARPLVCYSARFIGNTREAVEHFMDDVGTDEFRIDAVTIAEIMNDFGSSCGEFAMESEAFRRFTSIAAANGIRFEATPFDGDESLMVVEVEGARYARET